MRPQNKGGKKENVGQQEKCVANDRAGRRIDALGIVIEPVGLRKQHLKQACGHQFPEEWQDAAAEAKILAYRQYCDDQQCAGERIAKNGQPERGPPERGNACMQQKKRARKAKKNFVSRLKSHPALSVTTGAGMPESDVCSPAAGRKIVK